MQKIAYLACVALATLVVGYSVTQAAPVDDGRLRSASEDPANWLSYGRDYANQRFSPLKQINLETAVG